MSYNIVTVISLRGYYTSNQASACRDDLAIYKEIHKKYWSVILKWHVTRCLKRKPKKISIHHALRPACKAWIMLHYTGQGKQILKYNFKPVYSNNHSVEAVSGIKNGSRIRKVIVSAVTKRIRHWWRHNLSNIKTNERSLSLYRIYKMQLLISLWKKYYLIVFLDHGALRSGKKRKMPLMTAVHWTSQVKINTMIIVNFC